MALTLADIRQAIYEVLDEPASGGVPSESQPRWPSAKLNRYINEGLRVFAEKSLVFRKKRTLYVRQYVPHYPVPDDLAEFVSVAYDGELLAPASSEQLDRLTNAWWEETGTPYLYLINDRNPDRIRLYPIPDTAGDTFSFSQETGPVRRIVDGSAAITFSLSQETGLVRRVVQAAALQVDFDGEAGEARQWHVSTNNVDIVYAYYPDDLAADSDVPPKPLDRDRALQYYALWKSYGEEGDSKAQAAAAYLGLFEQELGRFANRVRPAARTAQLESFHASPRNVGPHLPSTWRHGGY